MALKTLFLTAIGELRALDHERVADSMGESLEAECSWLEPLWLPSGIPLNSGGQADARQLLADLTDSRSPWRGHKADKLIGITEFDLFSTVFTYVFGEAHIGGDVAVVSCFRLRPEIYGLPEDPDLVVRRLVTECVHEAGHLYGVSHCREPGCAMNFSGAVEEIDLKSPSPCPRCRADMGLGECDSLAQGA